MSRAENRFAMVAPATRQVLERPEHADRQPARAGGLRLRLDRLPVVTSGHWRLFVLAAVTDALDGYFARLLNQDTPIGRQLDPLIDKVIVRAATSTWRRFPGPESCPGWSRRSSSASS